MAHMQNFKAGGAVGILKHDERTTFDKVQSRKNECIDKSRTYLNYNLAAPRKSKSLMEHVKSVCAENGVHLNNRKDLNVMTSWIITVPQAVPEEQYRHFFEFCDKWLEERYGKKYKLSATVHMDETTPHMHWSFIPVGFDKKNNRYTVSSKLVTTRQELRSFHQELSKALENEFGYDVGILNEATIDGNQEIRELKLQTAKKELEQVEEALKRSETHLKSLQGRVLKQEEVNAFKGKKTILGGLKDVKYEDYLSLVKTARYVKEAKQEIIKLKTENSTLRQMVKKLENKVEEASSVRISKENILKNNLRNEIKKEYEQYYFCKIPLNKELFLKITHDICCRAVEDEKNGYYVVKCPYSEADKLNASIEKFLNKNNFYKGIQL